MTITIMIMIMEKNRTAMPPIDPATTATGNVDSPPPPPACMEKIGEFDRILAS